jgi:hypothetical protein
MQPDTAGVLMAGDVGTMDGTTHALFSYSAVQHRGLIYLTALEFWGAGAARQPSIYYGVFAYSRHLCRVVRQDWGVVASRDGLAVSFPVIGGRPGGGALLAYSFSGASKALPNSLGPAYPGGGCNSLQLSHTSTPAAAQLYKASRLPVVSRTQCPRRPHTRT